jgi:hypothetical protein
VLRGVDWADAVRRSGSVTAVNRPKSPRRELEAGSRNFQTIRIMRLLAAGAPGAAHRTLGRNCAGESSLPHTARACPLPDCGAVCRLTESGLHSLTRLSFCRLTEYGLHSLTRLSFCRLTEYGLHSLTRLSFCRLTECGLHSLTRLSFCRLTEYGLHSLTRLSFCRLTECGLHSLTRLSFYGNSPYAR